MYINTWRWESWGNEQGKHDNLKVVISFRWKSIHLIAKMHSGNHTHFLVIQRQKFPFFKMKEAGIVWTDHLPFEHEMGMDMCFTAETSNNSINLWSVTLALAAANRWYSSKTEERHHLCSFLKHPTRQPVRCFPRLQWIRSGWFLTSRTTFKASRIVSSGMLTKGSWMHNTLDINI